VEHPEGAIARTVASRDPPSRKPSSPTRVAVGEATDELRPDAGMAGDLDAAGGQRREAVGVLALEEDDLARRNRPLVTSVASAARWSTVRWRNARMPRSAAATRCDSATSSHGTEESTMLARRQRSAAARRGEGGRE